MNNHEKFFAFIESIETENNSHVIDIVLEAYTACYPESLNENIMGDLGSVFKKAMFAISMLASISSAASAEEIMPEVNKALAAIAEVAKNSPEGGYAQRVAELGAKLTRVIKDVVDDKAEGAELANEVSEYYQEKIIPIKGESEEAPKGAGLASSIKSTADEARAELDEYAKSIGAEPEVAMGEVDVKKPGFFGGTEKQFYAYDTKQGNKPAAAKRSAESTIRNLSQKYFK